MKKMMLTTILFFISFNTYPVVHTFHSTNITFETSLCANCCFDFAVQERQRNIAMRRFLSLTYFRWLHRAARLGHEEAQDILGGSAAVIAEDDSRWGQSDAEDRAIRELLSHYR